MIRPRQNASLIIGGTSMARASTSIEDVINAAVDRVTTRILARIDQAIAGAAVSARRGTPPSAVRRRRRPTAEMTRWVADRRARRVPTFVIEATGLDTKKKIVARYGENAAFEKGKPLPAVKAGAAKNVPDTEGPTSPAVKAKAPVVKKRASA
jgi:hypothetical protein